MNCSTSIITTINHSFTPSVLITAPTLVTTVTGPWINVGETVLQNHYMVDTDPLTWVEGNSESIPVTHYGPWTDIESKSKVNSDETSAKKCLTKNRSNRSNRSKRSKKIKKI